MTGRINFNGRSQFLIWPRLEYLSLYFWYHNIITGSLTDCILDSLKPFEEIGKGTRLRKGPETIKRCFYTLLNSFGWFVCVRVKTFNSKFVRDVSLKFPFVLPLSDIYIEKYWAHLISWEWFPTLSFSWRDYVKLILIFKIFVRILWSNYHGLISFSKVLYYIFNVFKCYRTIQIIYFCFKYFESVFIGVYIFRISMYSCWVDSFILI